MAAHGPGEVTIDIGTAVDGWWQVRRALRCWQSGSGNDPMALVAQLDAARTRVRRELALVELRNIHLQHAEHHVAPFMTQTGNVVQNVGRMLQDTVMEATDLVKLGRVLTCGACGLSRCNVLPKLRTVPVATPPMLTVIPTALHQMRGSVTQVVAAKLTEAVALPVACVDCCSESTREGGGRVDGTAEAVVAGQVRSIDAKAWCSAANTPPLLLLELPEILFEGLRLDESMEVPLPCVDGYLQVDYHLRAVIFHTGGHYVCDARSANGLWLRYDGLVGPSATQCARPTGNGSWGQRPCRPVLALYAR